MRRGGRTSFRKGWAALLVLLFLSLPLSASIIIPGSSGAYKHLLDPVTVMDPARRGMGGAGIALYDTPDALYLNPASLASRDFKISVPYLTVTLYNPYELYQSGVLETLIDDGYEEALDELVDFVDSYGLYSKLAQIDAGLTLYSGGFGFGLAVQDTVHLYSPGNFVSTQVVNELNVLLTLGYGHRLYLSRYVTLDIGASVSLSYLAYNEAVSAAGIADNYSDIADYLLTGTPFFAGCALPVKVGATLNLPFNFSLGATLENINGTYYMKEHENIESLWDNLISDPEFKFSTDMDLSVGFAWSFDLISRVIKPTIACDIDDVVGLFNDGLSKRNILGHLRAGAEIEIFTFISLRAGLYDSYWTLGAGLDFKLFRVDLAYFNEEYGSTYGEKGLSGLTVRVKVGLE